MKSLFKINKRFFSGGFHGKIETTRNFVAYDPKQYNNINGFFSLTGLTSDTSNKIENTSEIIQCEQKYLRSFNPFDIVNTPNNLRNVHPEENPYFHSEHYGYELPIDVNF